jgi:hypothetical protein
VTIALVTFGLCALCTIGVGINAFRTPREVRYRMFWPAVVCLVCLAVTAVRLASTAP